VYADWGIRCNVIQPGFIETDMTAKINSNPPRAQDDRAHDEPHDGNERSHHMLTLLKKKEEVQEFLQHFR